MAITINGILCQEHVNGFQEGASWRDGGSARKGYVCGWSDRWTVAYGLLGLTSTVSIGGVITLNAPLKYPEGPPMYVQMIEIEPHGLPTQGTNQVQWTNAIVWATFGFYPWSFSGIDYQQIDPSHPYIWAKQNINFTTETITIPGRMTKFASSGNSTGQDYGFPVAVAELEITLIKVPYLPAQEIITALQSPINSVTYLGCAAGTLFFRGARNQQTRATDGTFTCDVSYTFAYRPIAPWDYAYDGQAGAWNKVVDQSGNTLIPRSDLSTIIPTYY